MSVQHPEQLPTLPAQRCANCFLGTAKGDGDFWRYRYAPSPAPDTILPSRNVWPTVGPTEWCGE